MATIGPWIAVHAEWLAAQDFAADASDELHELAHGQPWRVAYPGGTRVAELGPCPSCAGRLRAIIRPASMLLPSEVTCDGDAPHRWDSTQWRQLDRAVNRKVAA